jgi:hypothetical protein
MARLLRPVSAFHYIAPRSMSVNPVCRFIADELPLRASHLSSIVSQQPNLVSSQRFISALGTLHESALNLKPGSDSLLDNVSANMEQISIELTHLLDMQRAQVTNLRNLQDDTRLVSLCTTLDVLQYNVIGCRTLVSNAVGLRAGRGSAVQKVDALAAAHDTTESVRAFAVEKFGAAPEVIVSSVGAWLVGPQPQRASHYFVGVPEYYNFVLVELLKNAIVAMVDAFGASKLDDAPPIRLTISSNQTRLGVCVSDIAGGFRGISGAIPVSTYYTSTVKHVKDSYHYSRTHGVPFSGLGLGLVRARLFAQHLGGALCVVSQPGRGVDAHFSVDSSGMNTTDVWGGAMK